MFSPVRLISPGMGGTLKMLLLPKTMLLIEDASTRIDPEFTMFVAVAINLAFPEKARPKIRALVEKKLLAEAEQVMSPPVKPLR